jgi:hypothetical protein
MLRKARTGGALIPFPKDIYEFDSDNVGDYQAGDENGGDEGKPRISRFYFHFSCSFIHSRIGAHSTAVLGLLQ